MEIQRCFRHRMVELKARVDEHNFLRKKLVALGAEYMGTFQQSDQYFMVPEGRLKLRTVEGNNKAELIYYERENIAGPKSDEAFILRVHKLDDLKNALQKILAPLIVIEKSREIYLYKEIQIHFDTVKKLGKFIEFEKQTSDENIRKDRRILEALMQKLEISLNNLETLSYSDLAEN
jgi:adenylate cyclase class 2